MLRLRVLTSAALAALVLPAAAAAAPVEDEIIVKRRPGLSAAERAGLRADAQVRLDRVLPGADTEVVVAADGDRADALADLRRDPDVVWAEPNRPRRLASVPADFWWSKLWGLENTGQFLRYGSGVEDADIDAPAAWALSRGGGVTVAVVDTGAQLDHPDLRLAGNPGEQGTDASGNPKASNGVDDDGNGYVDDHTGWDFVSGDNTPQDGHGHGTHVSGTIAAPEDGRGVVGVAPGAAAMPLRALDDDGTGSTADVAEAFHYAGELGVDVVNASIGSYGLSYAERDAIAAHPDTLYVVAAGNDANDNDALPSYPCAYPQANIVCVAATNASDLPASFTNYGATTVDLYAPGVDIMSTYLGSAWAWMSGTSMATPHVAGTAALLYAYDPALTPAEVKAALLGSAEPKAALLARPTLTGARLNAADALASVAGTPEDTTGPGPEDDTTGPAPEDDTAGPPPPPAPSPSEPPPAPAPAPEVPAVPEPVPAPVPDAGAPQAAPRAERVDTRQPVQTLGGVRLTGRVAGNRTARLTFSVGAAGTVRVQIEQRVCRRGRCRYRARAVRRVTVRRAGRQRWTVGRSLAGYRLRPGTYRVTLITADDRRSLTLTVRR
jgi:subtilisin family serine protease